MATASNKTSASTSGSAETAKRTDSTKAVPVSEGQKHGYIGTVHPDKNRDDYTVTGEEPTPTSVDDRSGWAPIQR